jgi:DNA-binding CsgD family transcriptional regulator
VKSVIRTSAVTAITFLRGGAYCGDKNMGRNRARSGGRRSRIDLQLGPKERQALKLAEIREALVAAGYDTTAKQAAILGIGRSTAWWLLNHDKRAGPSAKVIKRILLSPQIPKRVRRKVEQYVEEKVRGIFGHSEQRTQWFSEQFHRSPKLLSHT